MGTNGLIYLIDAPWQIKVRQRVSRDICTADGRRRGIAVVVFMGAEFEFEPIRVQRHEPETRPSATASLVGARRTMFVVADQAVGRVDGACVALATSPQPRCVSRTT